MKKRGQVSIELVITVGFALLMIIPITLLLYEHMTTTREDIYVNQAGLIARDLADAADSVYYLGHPSTMTIKAYFPEHINNITFQHREIVINMDNSQQIVAMSVVNLTGSISPDSGLKHIRIKALNNITRYAVNISEDDT